MDECYHCGISGNKVSLFKAISKEGIVVVCEKCSLDEGVLSLKPKDSFLESPKPIKSKKTTSVYERLKRISGIGRNNQVVSIKSDSLRKQEGDLKKIVDEKVKIEVPGRNSDLIDNFHWVLMRTRRMRKITQEQIAKEINEPEESIRLLEKGVVPRGYLETVKKLENFLEVKLMKNTIIEGPKNIGFDTSTTKTLTISDIKKVDQKKNSEEKIVEKPKEVKLDKKSEKNFEGIEDLEDFKEFEED